MSSSRTIHLKSSDGVLFEIEETVSSQLGTIQTMVEHNSMKKNTIPLLHITSTVLEKVIEFCKKHSGAAIVEDDVENWNEEFVKLVDVPALIDLVLAAKYLENERLLDLTCKEVDSIINGKA